MDAQRKRGIIAAVGFGIALFSMFLPFRVQSLFEYSRNYSLWAKPYDPNISGFDLKLPVFSLLFLLGIFLLIWFGKNQASRVITMLLGIFNVMLMLVIYLIIHTNIFSVSDSETGFGFFVLSAVALGIGVLTIVHITRPIDVTKPGTSVNDDKLDF